MANYQGRALERGRRRRGGGRGLGARFLAGAIVVLVAVGLAMLPWRTMRRRWGVVTGVRVTGLRYLDAARIRRESGLVEGADLFAIDFRAVRQRLMMDPRVARAAVRRSGLRGIELAIEERTPALAVTHGEPWEVDSSGVLLEPLQAGVVADVPMLTGADLSAWRAGTQVGTTAVQRGLAWAAILGDNALRLSGQVSEVDVSEDRATRLILMDGVCVIGPAWPASTRQLSGLRATLADLGKKGMKPREVDVRVPEQIIVRDARPVAAPAAVSARTS